MPSEPDWHIPKRHGLAFLGRRRHQVLVLIIETLLVTSASIKGDFKRNGCLGMSPCHNQLWETAHVTIIMIKTPERFIWATALLDVKPTDHILEIGCGAGRLAEQIASRLAAGQLIALDKSLPMLEKAKKRNSRFIDSGLSRFLATDFLKTKLPESYFDRIVAFNVSFFFKSPVAELAMIKQILKPQGKLYIFYQAPFETDIASAAPIRQELVKNDFEIMDIQLKKLSPTSACCIVARQLT